MNREGYVVFAGQLMSVLGLLLSIKVLTGVLDPSVYGLLSLLLTFVVLSGQMIFGPLGAGLQRFYSKAKKANEESAFFKECFALCVWACFFSVFAVLISFSVFLQPFSGGDYKSAFLVILISLLSGISIVINALANGARKRVFVAFHSSLDTWGKLVGALVLLYFLGNELRSVLLGYLAASIVVFLSQSLYFYRKNRISIFLLGKRKGHLKVDILKFVFPFCLFGFFTWAQMASERWSLGFFVDAEAVGYFAIILQLGFYPMSFVSSIVTQYFAPIFYAQFDKGQVSLRSKTNRIALLLVFVAIGGFFVSMILKEWVFELLVDPEYHSVAAFFPYMVLSGGFFAAAQSVALNLMARMEIKKLALIKSGVALFGVFSSILGAIFWGVSGVVLASVIHSLMLLIFLLLITNSESTN